MELPSALKKSPNEPASARGARNAMDVAIDDEIAVRRETVHAGFCFAEIGSGAGHPVIRRALHRLDIGSWIDVAIELIRGRQISEAVKGEFHSVAEIGKPIKRRGKPGAIEQKRGKFRSLISLCRRGKPDLYVALHTKSYTKAFQHFLEPRT